MAKNARPIRPLGIPIFMDANTLERSVVLLTRDYPFGSGETFAEEEVDRLAGLGPLVVVPAFPSDGIRRDVPDGVVVDTSLSKLGPGELLRPRVLIQLLMAAGREIVGRPSILVRPAAIYRFLGYLYRGGRVLAWIRIANRDRRDHPRRVMAFWSNAEAFGMAVGARQRPSIMLFCRSHRFDVWEEQNPASYLPFRTELARSSHRFLPSSREAAEYLRRTLPVDANAVAVAPLGIKPPFLPDAWRDRGEILIVSCSTGARVKRLPLIAASIAAAAAADSTRRWRWAHLGGGENQILDAVGNSPKNLDVELPGWLGREEIYRFHRKRQPNCFVNMSSSEGVPLSIMEALSMRIPVVATASGGTGEMVNDTVGAILPVTVDTAVAAAAITRVVNAGEPMRIAARRQFETKASNEVALAALQRVAPELLTSRT